MILTYQEKQPTLATATRGNVKYIIPDSNGRVLDYRLIRQQTNAGDPRVLHA